MRIVRLLVGHPPVTVSQLIQATGVTRTAVTEQLNELIACGFVERTTERLVGRGRPRHLYSITSAALLLLFASNQGVVIPVIWRAIREMGGPGLTQNVIQRVTQAVVEHYRPRITGRTPEERLRQLSDMLNQEGHLVEVTLDPYGDLMLHKRTCPFISMYEDTRTICGVDLNLLSVIVGAPVRQVASRHDGAPCCIFAVRSQNGD
jgi:predicted ArsR family transcriptional regulator